MIEFKIDSMSCGHCVGVITKTVKQLDPAATVQADVSSKIVKVASAQSRDALAAALTGAGYAPA